MPEHFEIVHLPQEIVLWLTALLLRLPVKEQLRKRRLRTKDSAWQHWVEHAKSRGIIDDFYLDRLTRPSRNKLMGAFAMAMRVRDNFQGKLMFPWLRAQSKVPSCMYHRPSGTTADQIPQRMGMGSLANFYHSYSEASVIKILQRNNEKLSQQVC
jgi:hypothetical protein